MTDERSYVYHTCLEPNNTAQFVRRSAYIRFYEEHDIAKAIKNGWTPGICTDKKVLVYPRHCSWPDNLDAWTGWVQYPGQNGIPNDPA